MSSIEWTDVTWNPVRGCSRVSEGCRNCYAERTAARFGWVVEGASDTMADGTPDDDPRRYADMTVFGPRWSGEVRLVPHKLPEPLHWRRPRRVFVNSMSDLFHEQLPFGAIAAVFGVMAACPQHTFQVLTKRPERAREFFAWLDARASDTGGAEPNEPRWRILHCLSLAGAAGAWALGKRPGPIKVSHWPLANVWLGVSVENQETANERIPVLIETPAEVKFVSAEPLLGPIDFGAVPGFNRAGSAGHDLLRNWWIIVGGESGPGARPCCIDWVEQIIRQCRTAGVPCFVKQLGAHATSFCLACRDPHRGQCRLYGGDDYEHGLDGITRLYFRDPKGGNPAEWPPSFRVREFPEAG